MNRNLKYGLIGLAGGGIGGLFGIGGGVIMIPLLTWIGLEQKRAQGSSLLATAALSVIGAASYYQGGFLDLRSAIPLAVGGMAGAFIGAGLVRVLSNRILYRLFGAFTIAIAIRHIYTALELIRGVEFDNHASIVTIGVTGVLAGLIAGFFGVGGGIIFVPAGVQLLGLGERAAHGLSFVAIILTTATAFSRYSSAGDTEKGAFIPLIIGAAAGSLISSNVAVAINDTYLAVAFAIFLCAIGIRRIFTPEPNMK